MPFELPWYVFAAAMINIVLFVLGVLIRAGVLRYWERNYWNRDLPIELRNGPFFLLPASVALSSVWIVLALSRLHLPRDLEYVPIALAPVAGLLSLITLYRPPDFLKPRWLREKERAIREGRATVPPSLPPRRLSRRAYILSWTALLVALVAFFLLSLPPSLLIGFAFAAAGLFAMRPDPSAAKRR